MTIPHFFVEGNTETKVLEKLKLIEPVTTKPETGGKDDINKRMHDVLGPRLGVEPIRCLVMRDLDSHVKETSDGIRSGVEQTLRRLFDERGFVSQNVSLSPHDKHENVYTFQAIDPNIKVALHIAIYCCLDHFVKSTVDDYVLNLALRNHTPESFLQKNRKRDWTIAAEALIDKVQQEIPALLQKNGIPPLGEAKDYVRLYAAVLQMHTSPPVFAERALAHAQESDIREVFAPLLAAAQFLSDDPVMA
ncbi:MAG: hypothetical protein ACREBD_07215 [Blastocatellia bacterium]